VSPAPIDPGPFAIDAAVVAGIAHPDLGAFAVAADVPFEPYQLPEPATIAAPEPIDPGPFAVGATTADVLAHADLGAFAVAADVAYEPFTLPEPAELEPESELESPSEPEPEHEAPEDASPEPVAAAVPSAPPSGPRPVTPVAHSRKPTVLETAMRLDNKQTTLVRYVGLVARVGSRLFADVQVEGLEHIPRTGPVILACNHISNADPVVLGAWITQALRRRRIHWLGKKELFDWPVVGRMAASGGVHPVDRDAADVEAFRLASRILEKGYVLLVFPEGTRSPTGELQEAKDGVALLAIRTGAQVVPIGVSNTDAVWQKGQPLPMPFPRRRVTVRIGTPFRVQDVIPEGTDRRAAKGLATRAIMGRIAALLDPRHRGVYADAIREASRPEG
jgi:1-acyl-sn-glycerol-3-phosphate acyltransferase